MLLLQIPSLSRKQGSLTTESRESCLMMLFSLSVFRFWYISWLRSWRKWLTLGLVGLAGRPPLVPRPWAGLLDKESSQPFARSRQQLQQSRPMGERQSSSDILKCGWMKRRDAQVWKCRCRNLRDWGVSRWKTRWKTEQLRKREIRSERQAGSRVLSPRRGQEVLKGRLSSSLRGAVTLGHSDCFLSLSFLLLWLCRV